MAVNVFGFASVFSRFCSFLVLGGRECFLALLASVYLVAFARCWSWWP